MLKYVLTVHLEMMILIFELSFYNFISRTLISKSAILFVSVMLFSGIGVKENKFSLVIFRKQ